MKNIILNNIETTRKIIHNEFVTTSMKKSLAEALIECNIQTNKILKIFKNQKFETLTEREILTIMILKDFDNLGQVKNWLIEYQKENCI